MIKVRYNVVLQSQLGPRSGELLLQEGESGTVFGELCLLNSRNHFSGSVLQSGKYLISGALRSRVEKEPYDAIFTVSQGRLYGGLVTRHGAARRRRRLTPPQTRTRSFFQKFVSFAR